MGRPYQIEIKNLPDTVAWAINYDISLHVEQLVREQRCSLISIGSGGSLSAARLAAGFHQAGEFGLGKAMTPLEAVSLTGHYKDASVLLLSASGANRDIIAAFRHLVQREPKYITTMTCRVGSPLAKLARQLSQPRLFEVNVPSGRDGFLATNSLAAFSVILGRAYATAVDPTTPPLGEITQLVRSKKRWESYVRTLERISNRLWSRDHLVVLYPPEAEAGAFDIESKFTEAALGNVHIADYRHFAHGRHHWLAKKGNTSAVLAFVTAPYRRLAEHTLSCLPRNIPVTRVNLSANPFTAGVSSVLTAIILAGCVGRYRGTDPGRPGVPMFGRKIYHLRWKSPQAPGPTKHARELLAIERKRLATGQNGDFKNVWQLAFRRFCDRLRQLRFKAVILDYDGTMVFTANRFEPLPSDVTEQIIKLLRAGVVVGVASGRGKSLRESLQHALPRGLWSRVDTFAQAFLP